MDHHGEQHYLDLEQTQLNETIMSRNILYSGLAARLKYDPCVLSLSPLTLLLHILFTLEDGDFRPLKTLLGIMWLSECSQLHPLRPES